MRAPNQDSHVPCSRWRRQITIRAAHVEPGRWAFTVLTMSGTEQCEVWGEGGHICRPNHIRSRRIGSPAG